MRSKNKTRTFFRKLQAVSGLILALLGILLLLNPNTKPQQLRSSLLDGEVWCGDRPCAEYQAESEKFFAEQEKQKVTATKKSVPKKEEVAKTKTNFLGSGFEQTIPSYKPAAKNALVEQRGGDFAASGIGQINALLYNAKDFLKYAASSAAVLWIIISAFQLVTAQDDNGIKAGKKGVTWGIIGLFLVFVVDVAIIAFFEGGSLTGSPGESIVASTTRDGQIVYSQKLNEGLTANMAAYFSKDIKQIFEFIKVFGSAIAILFIVIAGFQIVTAGGDEQDIEKEKKYLLHAITAFVTLLMLETFIFQVIYPGAKVNGAYVNHPECVEYLKYGFAEAPAGCKSAAALGEAGSNYILGVVNFFESLIGGIAVFFIVNSGVHIIASFGKKEVLDKYKKTLFWSLGGLALILLSHNVVGRFFFVTDFQTGKASVNVQQGMIDLAGVTNFLASFVGIFALISLLIAGIVWVANFGNTETANKAKKVVFGAVVGIIISLSAYAIVNTILSGNAQNIRSGAQVDARLN